MKRTKFPKLETSSEKKLINAYYMAFIVVSALFWLVGALSGGETTTKAFFFSHYGGLYSSDLFMDFFNSARDASGLDVYDNGVIYPPIVNLFYFIVAKFMSPTFLDAPFSRRIELRNNDLNGLLIYLLITFFALMLVYKTIDRYLIQKSYKSSRFAFCMTAMFSYPVIYCLQRGNILLFAFLFTLFFVLYRNSENAFVRELAYVSLALAAGIKIYPALFGILLIYDKKYKDAVRLVLYGIIIFFLPFLFYGGTDGLKAMVENITNFSGDKSNAFIIGNCSIQNLFLITESPYAATAFYFTEALAIVMLTVFRKTTQRVLVLCYILLNVKSIGEPYMLMFLIIPFVMLISNAGKLRKIDKLYFVMIAVMLVPLPCFFYSAVGSIASKITEWISVFGVNATENLVFSVLASPNKSVEMILTQLIFVVLIVDAVLTLKSDLKPKTVKSVPAEVKEKNKETETASCN